MFGNRLFDKLKDGLDESDMDCFQRILSATERMSALIENLLKSSPAFLQAHIHGNNRRYLTALIVANPEELLRQAQRLRIQTTDIGRLIQNEKLQKWLAQCVSECQKPLARYQKLKYFTLMQAEFSQEKGEMTPTLKLKRRVIDEHYRNVLEGMYRENPEGILVP